MPAVREILITTIHGPHFTHLQLKKTKTCYSKINSRQTRNLTVHRDSSCIRVPRNCGTRRGQCQRREGGHRVILSTVLGARTTWWRRAGVAGPGDETMEGRKQSATPPLSRPRLLSVGHASSLRFISIFYEIPSFLHPALSARPGTLGDRSRCSQRFLSFSHPPHW